VKRPIRTFQHPQTVLLVEGPVGGRPPPGSGGLGVSIPDFFLGN